MNKKNRMTQIMAFLALFWIIIWIVWTWLLVIFGGSENPSSNLDDEQLIELQNYLNTLSWSTETMSWIEIETLTWSETE